MLKIKVMYKAWLIVFILVLCFVGIIFIGGKMNILNSKCDKIISISYSNSGDMLGNVDSTTLNEDKMIMTTKYATTHSDPIEITEYRVSKEDIEKINAIIKKNNIHKLSKLPMGDLFAYDAATPILTITCDNSKIGGSSLEFYSINYYMKLSKKNREQLKEVTDNLFSLKKEENKIKTYTENN